jgi:O-acetyl-ADP-ribose deacetylase (regulator of RNase III)
VIQKLVIKSDMSVSIIPMGDIIQANEQIIIHQCNCVSTYGKGLATIIFKKWKESNIYSKRTKNSKTGTIDITETSMTKKKNSHNKIIIGTFSQKYPGKPHKSDDTTNMRIKWFKNCLTQIAEYIDNKNNNNNNNENNNDENDNNELIKSVAMPYFIGCGLAGGDWKVYYKIISDWSNENEIDVVLYDINNFHE